MKSNPCRPLLQRKNVILGIESSCDESAAAIYDSEHGLLAHALHSQVALHADYGGVVPEIAARSHLDHIETIIAEALTQAEVGNHFASAFPGTGAQFDALQRVLGGLNSGSCPLH